ncbi:E3 SUMO-protein ligase ZBED1-like [Saccostrea cucullata]|uniref:E3 SUMO-protein ligase ZBED1-like n=1 Tax=Saccostrea cuccullata TaxID=36930 RepID=UPI002ED6B840
MASEVNNNQLQVELEIFPYPGNTKSVVWKYFGFLKKTDGPPIKANLDMTTAICRVCRKKYANKGNTTNFRVHIDSEHGGELEPKIKSNIQPRLDNFVKSNKPVGKISPERQSTIDDALNKLIIGKALPVSIVDNIYFRAFVELLDPRYKVPSRPTVIKRLEEKKLKVEEQLKTQLRLSTDISITHDGWTSLNTKSYYTTTAHFIDNDWCLQSAVLGTIKLAGSHTSQNIANELKNTQDRWSLPVPTATSDNAANEQKAYEILGWNRFGCYGHRINLVVKNSLTFPEVSRVLGKARTLVGFFHKSSSMTSMLHDKQKLLFSDSKVGHRLLIDVATRWNSTLYMLQRLLEQAPVLMALANDPSLPKHASTTLKNSVFSFEELTMVEHLVKILLPFEKATTIVCADQHPTMQKVLPIVTKLMRATEISDEDSAVIKKIKQKMQAELNKRTQSEDISLLACLLNPFTKGLDFAPEERERAHSLLRGFVCGITLVKKEKEAPTGAEKDTDFPPLPALPNLPDENTEENTASESNRVEDLYQPSTAKKMKSVDTDDWLEDVVCTGESKDVENVAEKELERYIGCQVEIEDHNLTILEWWKKNAVFFPRLSILAKKFLAIPASSVSSERVFSLGGQIVSKKRCRMSHNNVDLFIFLNKNIKYW